MSMQALLQILQAVTLIAMLAASVSWLLKLRKDIETGCQRARFRAALATRFNVESK
jgi:hypothetical protein